MGNRQLGISSSMFGFIPILSTAAPVLPQPPPVVVRDDVAIKKEVNQPVLPPPVVRDDVAIKKEVNQPVLPPPVLPPPSTQPVNEDPESPQQPLPVQLSKVEYNILTTPSNIATTTTLSPSDNNKIIIIALIIVIVLIIIIFGVYVLKSKKTVK
jgi:hypothetical protein